MEVAVNDRYDITVRQINESKRAPELVTFEQARSVTLDDFGTLTIEGSGTIRSFPQSAWGSFNVTKVHQGSGAA